MEEEKTFKLADILELLDYLSHDSWRCRHYQKCWCGLDELTDKLGISRIPYPYRD